MVEDWRQSLESVPKSKLIKFGTANLESSSIICVGPKMGHPWNQPVKLSSPVSLLKAATELLRSRLPGAFRVWKHKIWPRRVRSCRSVDFWGGELFSLLKLGMLPHRFVYKQHEMSAACLQDVRLQQLQSPGNMVIIVLQ